MKSVILTVASAIFVTAPLVAQQSHAAPRTSATVSVSGSLRVDSLSPVLRLTRQEAIAMALANNPTIVVAREQVAQARARVTQATAFPDPTVGFTVQGLHNPVWPNPWVETDLIFGVTIPFPDKFSLRSQVANGDVGALDAAYRLQRQEVANETAIAYDSLLVALGHRENRDLAKQLAADFLKKTEARFAAGTTPRLDVVKAEVGVAQAQNDFIANERGIANARAALNRLLGRILGSSVEALDSLEIVPVPTDYDRLEKVAMQERPELYAIDRQLAAASAARSLAQQYLLPDLNVSVTYNNPGFGVPSSFTSGVSVAVPLLFWQHQGGEVAEARHHQLELIAAQRDAIGQVGQDLRNAFAAASTSYQQAVFIRDELLPSADEQYQIAIRSYTLGGSSALEVLDARRTLIDARDQYYSALGALNDALSDLERAVGAPLDTVPADAKSN
jgi:outer membrane protein, heavy metal efflux system